MTQTFRGEFNLKVDAKGRVSIPATFRRVIEAGDPEWTNSEQRARFVIVYGDQSRRFLECYTMKSIEEVEAQIASLPRGSIRRRKLARLISTYSHHSEVDEDGRIVLPQKLREKIELQGEAYFAAMLDTFQIWKPETFAEAEANPSEDDSDLLALLDAPEDG